MKLKNRKIVLLIISSFSILLGIHFIFLSIYRTQNDLNEDKPISRIAKKNICILKVKNNFSSSFLYFTNNRLFVNQENCNISDLPILTYKENLQLQNIYLDNFFEKWYKIWSKNKDIINYISEIVLSDKKVRIYLSFSKVIVDINDITKKNWEEYLLATILWMIDKNLNKGYIDLSEEYGLIIYSGEL